MEPLIKTLVPWKLLLQSDSVKLGLHQCISLVAETFPSFAYDRIMIADAKRDKVPIRFKGCSEIGIQTSTVASVSIDAFSAS